MKQNPTVGWQDQHWSHMPAVLEPLYADFSENRGDELPAVWQPC
jgi:hypothetical protein